MLLNNVSIWRSSCAFTVFLRSAFCYQLLNECKWMNDNAALFGRLASFCYADDSDWLSCHGIQYCHGITSLHYQRYRQTSSYTLLHSRYNISNRRRLSITIDTVRLTGCGDAASHQLYFVYFTLQQNSSNNTQDRDLRWFARASGSACVCPFRSLSQDISW